MNLISSEKWIPQGIESLENSAEQVVKNIDDNIMVTAGPGAGKSELLAQKASFFLQTGACRRDKRILAISFKKDSAKNLKERVELRCGKQLANQFDSMTFDAFAKSMLDRFKLALPPIWKIDSKYEIDFTISNYREMGTLLDSIGLTAQEIASLEPRTFERYYLTAEALPIEGFNENSIAEKATKNLWNLLLYHFTPSRLSFTMIGRLVELIFRTNPKLLLALQSTYSYVFLDEFQDTTSIQYDLLKTCFLNSDIKITAVGDDKQTIMSWAGALPDIFNIYKTNFSAVEYQLINNYRSSPTLVNIQNIIVNSLMGITQTDTISMREEKEIDKSCRVLFYKNETQEAQDISQLINNLIINEKIPMSEICILTKQQPDMFTEKLQNELRVIGIKSRVENELQDLLSEPITSLVFSILRLIFLDQSSSDWIEINEYLLAHYSNNYQENEEYITDFLNDFRDNIIENIDYTDEGILDIIQKISLFLNDDILKSTFQQYSQGNYLQEIKSKIANYLNTYLSENNMDWILAIDAFEGKDSIKIMTMHKSKGLEFNTVIFMGLEDNSHWSYKDNPNADNNGFFVAFSRAKERIIFTVSHREHYRSNASIKNITPIFNIFKQAGVEREDRSESVSS